MQYTSEHSATVQQPAAMQGRSSAVALSLGERSVGSIRAAVRVHVVQSASDMCCHQRVALLPTIDALFLGCRLVECHCWHHISNVHSVLDLASQVATQRLQEGAHNNGTQHMHRKHGPANERTLRSMQ